MQSIYLVRHAQSEANVDPSVLHEKHNAKISLTAEGHRQAEACASFLYRATPGGCKLWKSPYLRTRQTAGYIEQALEITGHEAIHLTERQLGLVDEVPNYRHKYPEFAQMYRQACAQGAEFFVRPPLGESPYDVVLRLDQFVQSRIVPETEKADKANIVLVAHGAVIKCLLMVLLEGTYESVITGSLLCNAGVHKLTHNGERWIDNGVVFVPNNETY